MLEITDPFVSICCITYNHENFIRDAIEGFLMQKTDFPVEIIIRDDASTDATAAIVRQYQTEHPDLIRAIYHTQNQFTLGKRAFPEVFAMARGKYIALCEGDDYWTDPLKLQKQVDFMESHPECSLCAHNVLVFSQDEQKKLGLFADVDKDQIFTKEDFFKKSMVNTSSMLFCKTPLQEYFRKISGIQNGDWALQAFLLKKGYIGFLNETMSVYRIHEGGIWSSSTPIAKATNFIRTMETVQKVLNYSNEPELNKKLAGYYLFLMIRHYKEKNFVITKKLMKKVIFKYHYLDYKEKQRFWDVTKKVYFQKLFITSHRIKHKLSFLKKK